MHLSPGTARCPLIAIVWALFFGIVHWTQDRHAEYHSALPAENDAWPKDTEIGRIGCYALALLSGSAQGCLIHRWSPCDHPRLLSSATGFSSRGVDCHIS